MNEIIKLVDEQGNEKEFRYFFAVEHEETKVLYAFFVETNTNRPEVVVYKFDNDGALIDLETEEEWAYAQQEFNAYVAQMRQGGCGGCHGGCHDGGCNGDCDCEGGCDCE